MSPDLHTQRQRAKESRFDIAYGSPGTFEFALWLAISENIVDLGHRLRYAEEREHPEWVDVGGES